MLSDRRACALKPLLRADFRDKRKWRRVRKSNRRACGWRRLQGNLFCVFGFSEISPFQNGFPIKSTFFATCTGGARSDQARVFVSAKSRNLRDRKSSVLLRGGSLFNHYVTTTHFRKIKSRLDHCPHPLWNQPASAWRAHYHRDGGSLANLRLRLLCFPAPLPGTTARQKKSAGVR